MKPLKLRAIWLADPCHVISNRRLPLCVRKFCPKMWERMNKSFNNLTTHSSRYWLLLDWQAIAYPVRSFWSFLLKLPSFARFYFFLLGLIPSIALMGECLWGSHLYHLVIQLPLPNLSFFTLFFNEFDISQ